jgi:hypothetical protein
VICFLGGLHSFLRAAAVCGAGLLSERGQRRIQTSPARAHRNADRGYRRDFATAWRTTSDNADSSRRTQVRSRQHRIALQRRSIFRYSTSAPVGPGTPIFRWNLRRSTGPTANMWLSSATGFSRFSGRVVLRIARGYRHQILNFGLPGADRRIRSWGAKWSRTARFAEKLMNQLKFVPGTVDLRIQQPFNYPNSYRRGPHEGQIRWDSRSATWRRIYADLAERQLSDRADFLARSRNGSELQHRHADAAIQHQQLQDLENIPSNGTHTAPQILAGWPRSPRRASHGVVSHYDISDGDRHFRRSDRRDWVAFRAT